jgi:hypothetical protein
MKVREEEEEEDEEKEGAGVVRGLGRINWSCHLLC